MDIWLKDFDPVDDQPRTGFQAFNVEMRVENNESLQLLISVLAELNCDSKTISKLKERT